MKFVYLIKSLEKSDHRYIGITSDLKSRVQAHNNGESKHTKKYAPWKLIWYCAFENEKKAFEFEKYLKSNSGRAFANKRFW